MNYDGQFKRDPYFIAFQIIWSLGVIVVLVKLFLLLE